MMRLFQLNIQAAMARRVERAERSHCCGADSPVQLASSIFYLSSFFLSLFLPPSPSYLLSSVLSLSVYIYIFFFFFFLLPYTHNLVPDDDGMSGEGERKRKAVGGGVARWRTPRCGAHRCGGNGRHDDETRHFRCGRISHDLRGFSIVAA